jgi:hypothetical protein
MRTRADRPTIAGCRLLLDAHELRANGCLRPGWSGKWRIGERSFKAASGGGGGGDGKAVVSIHLRAEADRLHLSWDSGALADDAPAESSEDETGEMTETVSLFHVSNHFGGGYTLFVCPGLQGDNDTRDDTGNDKAASAAVSCGKRAARLYLTRDDRFLCRQCSQLVYETPYELPWQRAIRRRARFAAALVPVQG